MSKKNKKREKRASFAGDPGLGSLGALLAAHGLHGTDEQTTPTDATAESSPSASDAVPARAVLRLQRKGRGGKTVTLVEHLALAEADLQRRARALRRALGTGVRVEGEALVVQGDQRDRIQEVLHSWGVRKITR